MTGTGRLSGLPGSGIVGGSSSFAGRVATLAVTTLDGTTVLDNGLLVTLTINTNDAAYWRNRALDAEATAQMVQQENARLVHQMTQVTA